MYAKYTNSMNTAAGAGKPRRTQEERSTATRGALLDATIECLVEYGYAGTTAALVASRAGVTRGAQVHHFGSKADLVTAATKHLATKRVDAAWGEIEAIRAAPNPIAHALDLMWDLHKGPLYVATVELWVAARTDPNLAELVGQVEPVVVFGLLQVLEQAVPSVDHKAVLDFAYTAMDVMRGILLSSFVEPNPAHLDRRWARARVGLLRLAAAEGIQFAAAGKG